MKKLIFFLIIISLFTACSDDEGSVMETKDSMLGFYALNGSSDDEGSYDRENYVDYGENSFISTSDEPVSTFAIDADGGSYANARRYLNLGQLPPVASVRVEEFINYFQFNYPDPLSEQVSLNNETAMCPWYNGHYLMRVGMRGKSLPENGLGGSNFVFLIDVSGSMSSPDKLELLKTGFTMLVNESDETDMISIVTYAGSAGVVLNPTPCSEKDKIIEAVKSLGSGGSTAGAEGIITAYALAEENFMNGGNNRVIIGSDGDFNVGPSSLDELVELVESKRDAGIYLSVLGVGQGNLNDAMMEQIANNGNGTYEYIDNVEQLKKVFIYERSKFYTVAKDCKVQLRFDSTKVDAYRLIGYENRVMENEAFENDSADAGEIGANQTITALYELVLTDAVPEYSTLAQWSFNYKKPGSEASTNLGYDIVFENTGFDEASENMRFAASVAGFGMLIKNSEYAGTLTFDNVSDWAQRASSFDPNGFRGEFIDLVGNAKILQ